MFRMIIAQGRSLIQQRDEIERFAHARLAEHVITSAAQDSWAWLPTAAFAAGGDKAVADSLEQTIVRHTRTTATASTMAANRTGSIATGRLQSDLSNLLESTKPWPLGPFFDTASQATHPRLAVT